MKLRSLLIGLLVAALPSLAFGQATILQGGTWTPGHVPMYVGQGSTIPVVSDAGAAAGGAVGSGVSELAITARGTGAAPFAGQGTGPLGTISCIYDGPITAAAGYHSLCFSANAQGGGLIAYNAGGAASQLPLSFNVNGTAYQFPFIASGIVGPGTTVVDDIVVWNNTSGTLVKDVSFRALCALYQFSSTQPGCAPLSGGGTSNFLRADGAWAAPGGGSVSSVTIGAGTGIAVSGTCTITSTGTCTVAFANAAAFTIVGNTTSGSAAPTSFVIGSLTQKSTPDANDILLLQDVAASNALKYTTVSAVAGTSAIPVGTLFDYTGAVAPTGYLIANGACVAQATYPALFAVLGTSWGSCGGGLFALPDFRGRVSAGVDSGAGRITNGGSGCTATLATGCGAQNRTLIAANVPQLSVTVSDPGHIHTITDPGHVHVFSNPVGSGASPAVTSGATEIFAAPGNTSSATTGVTVNSAVTSITATANTGSANTAAVVLNPVLIVTKIIKF